MIFSFSPQSLPETFIILRRIQRDMITNVYRSSCKVAVIVVRFELNLNFLDTFSEYLRVRNSMNIGPGVTEFYRARRRTDMT